MPDDAQQLKIELTCLNRRCVVLDDMVPQRACKHSISDKVGSVSFLKKVSKYCYNNFDLRVFFK